ncbi:MULTISPECIES: glucose-6-phosphate isomerase [unclassified Arthrobacter]|uniref:glucose-6-phosphate isomerase n=1 Tax=unclassified Arthrobacter TaxID=235627 RepID=UPI000E1EE998|nr:MULTISPECIES: glucose-6-phosphate isomerase [unclassified Arthrobacter]MDF2050130.1 glucose-6-phosphate isomerase [Arthrobacter sp. Cr_A7]RDV12802.1 glucose-6-phosphate isomerase [Arthrobacter sp. RT-1]
MSTLSYDATGAAQKALEQHLPALVEERIATRIFAKDHTLWGPDAESESAIRLGWVEAATVSQPLVKDILELRDALRAEGVTRIVLCGMGGSSLAPEVIAGTAGVELTVLDSTDPDQVRAALADRLAETAIVVSSKSGSTVETDSQRRIFEKAFNDAGIDAASRIIIVTDPGSPLDKASREAGYRAVFNADPNVGGRFSALTAFGLVPSGLAGVDIQAFLDEAEEAAEILNDDAPENIGLALGTALGGTTPLRNKIVIAEDGSGIVGFADWAEQLIAESTGKLGTGVLPVVAGPAAPEVTSGAPDVLVVRLVAADADVELGDDEVAIAGGLATQMMVWEFATAVAGRLLGINPFDQPDVEAAKVAARGLLDAQPEPTAAAFVDGAIEVRGGDWLGDAGTAESAVKALLGTLEADSYLSVQAYFDRLAFAELEGIRDELAAASGRPVTFGWGPRFLHSTGQFHKGGPAIGVFLQVTAAPAEDLEIPERPFTFGELISAQAAGDAQVLEGHGRPVLRLHLTNRAAGVKQLQDIVAALSARASATES